MTKAKVRALCVAAVGQSFDCDQIESCVRLGGSSKKGHNRLLKVKFEDAASKYKVMRSQRNMRENNALVEAFGRIYVNPDSTFLMRKEEKRLREKLKDLKVTAHETDMIYIRRGTLYRNNEVIDKINVANQLF